MEITNEPFNAAPENPRSFRQPRRWRHLESGEKPPRTLHHDRRLSRPALPDLPTYLREADRTLGEFAQRGVEVVAVSSDTRERAEQTRNDWGLKALPVGYGLSIDSAREWGLYVSTSRGKTSTGVMEPELFSEPGLFLVRPDQTLYAASYATMPFARPHFSELLKALDFIIANDYPARGEA